MEKAAPRLYMCQERNKVANRQTVRWHGQRRFTMFARAALSAGGDTRFMDAISAIGLSGLNAASVRVQVSASNLANTDDAAPLPGSGVAGPAPFVPMRVQTVSLGQGGVQAQLSAARPGWGRIDAAGDGRRFRSEGEGSP